LHQKTTMTSVAVINGPNLNLLGTRKPEVYGSTTLADVEQKCRNDAEALGLQLTFLQSNYEGQIIDWIHEIGAAVKAGDSIGAVYNPGAHTHYSYAIRDAIEGASLPVIELHISNVHARDEWRHHSVVSPLARGIIVGFGVLGYSLAITGIYELAKSDGRLSLAGSESR
jgi:3-dehydroquinate dehydratase-2